MDKRIIYKETFAVIGKMGEGTIKNLDEWIPPLWANANANFSEITAVAKQDENGNITVWGAMNDVNEKNKRWDEKGRYMASCEADVHAQAPSGWSKWLIPAQTYLVVDCTLDMYGEIFGKITNDPKIQIIGTVQEHYPEPGNPNILELWFPIANGMMFCQSCGMPMMKNEELGTESDGEKNLDYCCYCYKNGSYTIESTMEAFIEHCVPFVSSGNPYANENEARKAMQEFFPHLKRWKK